MNLEKKVDQTPEKEADLKEVWEEFHGNGHDRNLANLLYCTMYQELITQLGAQQEQLDNLDGALSELKASYEGDALSLVPWMNTLFALADAGITTFDVSGPSFPHCPLAQLFGESNSLDLFAGVEKMLGIFKRRFVQPDAV